MLHQFHKKIHFDYEGVKSGSMLLAFGLFKKIVIADRLSEYVDLVFKTPGNYDTVSIALALIFFYFQIYCDFSGYTDIARGSARMLGFELMKNFNVPFIADSLTNFWKRWHISLSTWLRDYVYEPLAIVMRYQGIYGIGLALLTTFFISGLWHGAKWTFVVWGLFNGIILLWEFLFGVYGKKNRILPPWLGKPLAIIRTFSLICISYIFFRADSMSSAILMLKKLFAFPAQFTIDKIFQTPLPHNYFLISAWLIIFLVIIELLNENGWLLRLYARLPKIVQMGVCQAFLVCLIWYGYWFKGHTSFIYFQF
jgi:D-alanyl-lipoteichoic acid acyltransferase DltB (MBOAT superfamily)